VRVSRFGVGLGFRWDWAVAWFGLDSVWEKGEGPGWASRRFGVGPEGGAWVGVKGRWPGDV
jgi:hypothetical protein